MKTSTKLSKSLGLLEQAEKKIFNFGIGDASDIIARLNLRYGIGKMLYSLEKRKIPTDSLFAVTSPDSSITRNKERWNAGFSYGCMIKWPSKKETGISFAFPQIKPNACGMLVGKLNHLPDFEQLSNKLNAIEKSGLRVNSENLKLNIGVSNHFIEICFVETSNNDALREGDFVAIIHTSPSEYKSVLYDFKGMVEKGASMDDTPFGPLLVLEGEQAESYLSSYKYIEEFGNQKRLSLAENLFGSFETISNLTHQGLFNDNEARLGLYKSNSFNELFPVTFKWNINIFLMNPKKNLDLSQIDKNDVSQTVLNDLNNTSLLPHGGGYEIPFVSNGWEVVENNGKRLFSLRDRDRQIYFSSPSELPFSYRGEQVLNHIKKLDLAEINAELKQVFTLKY